MNHSYLVSLGFSSIPIPTKQVVVRSNKPMYEDEIKDFIEEKVEMNYMMHTEIDYDSFKKAMSEGDVWEKHS